MRHSEFSTIITAMRHTEQKEFVEAIKAHGGSYTFITEEQIDKMLENDEEWEETVPTVTTFGIDNEDGVDVLVKRIETTKLSPDGDDYITITGESYRNRDDVVVTYDTLSLGDLHYIMDFMSEPLGGDK